MRHKTSFVTEEENGVITMFNYDINKLVDTRLLVSFSFSCNVLCYKSRGEASALPLGAVAQTLADILRGKDGFYFYLTLPMT